MKLIILKPADNGIEVGIQFQREETQTHQKYKLLCEMKHL
jgi:hypothetical protein